MEGEYKLCYVEGHKAWFTKLPLEEQWGDDWNDAPYKYNSEEPCAETEDQLFTLYFEGPFTAPCDVALNSPYSVESINKKVVPWLQQDIYMLVEGPPVMIWAGASVPEFAKRIIENDGRVYVATGDIDRFRAMMRDLV